MENNQSKKKIKGQKAGAIGLILFSAILLIIYFKKSDFEIIGLNNYILVVSLVILMICGLIGLKNSLRNEKELNEK